MRALISAERQLYSLLGAPAVTLNIAAKIYSLMVWCKRLTKLPFIYVSTPIQRRRITSPDLQQFVYKII